MAVTNTGMNVVNNRYKSDLPVLVLAGLVLITLAFVVWQILIIDGMIPSSLTSSLTSSLSTASNRNYNYNYNYNYKNQVDNHHVTQNNNNYEDKEKEAKLRSERVNYYNNDKKQQQHVRPVVTSAIFDESEWEERNKHIADLKGVAPNACGYNLGFKNLTTEELHPVAGKRHMVTPPEGGKLSLVCCETTKGNLAMVAHHKWAPLGAAHFLKMVTSEYFDSTVPMMRCLKDFLCQFGLNSDPAVSKQFRGTLKDDPNWLPEGPKFRYNSDGVKRFARGYLAYAGSGKNSRGNQLIMALKDDGPLAGGSPWEVPWGELVGKESFETLSKFYTGYGEDGPSQGKLQNRGMDEEMKKEFPELDYINKCVLVDEKEI